MFLPSQDVQHDIDKWPSIGHGQPTSTFLSLSVLFPPDSKHPAWLSHYFSGHPEAQDPLRSKVVAYLNTGPNQKMSLVSLKWSSSRRIAGHHHL